MKHDLPPLAKYAHLAQVLREQIREGLLPAGATLPAVRELARLHGVSLVTASRALHELEREGRIDAHRKSRFRVLAPSAPPATVAGREAAGPVSEQLLHTVMAVLDQHDVDVPLGGSTLDAGLIPHRALRRTESRLHRRLGTQAYAYEIAPGLAALRTEIARRLSFGGPPLSADEVTVTGGCLEAIALALDVCTRPGDTVLVETPTFFGLLQLLQRRGLQVAEVPLDPARGLSTAAVAAALARHPIRAACLTPSFNNPSGALTEVAEKRAIGHLLAAHGVTLIEDDAFGELGHGPSRPPPMIALCPQADVITCGSVSKTLAPGLRLGWAVRRQRAHGDRYRDLQTGKFVGSLGAPTLAQHLVADWMASGAYDRHLRRLRQLLPAQVAAYRDRVRAAFPAGTEVALPAGGFLLWVRLPQALDPLWLIRAAQSIGVGVVPGSAFQAQPAASPWLRLSAGLALVPRVERGLRELGALLSRDRSIP